MNKLIFICGLVMLGNTTTSSSEESLLNCESTETNQQTVLSVKNNPDFEMDINTIAYITEEDTIDLGFDTAAYLPTGFDPCTVYEDLSSITYMEEDTIDLGFETEAYLPSGFDPNTVYEDLSDIAYIDEESEIIIDFNIAAYLPKDFDPLARAK